MQRRNTKNKNCILKLFEKFHTLTAKQISKKFPDMELSTIYRNLERFVEDKILKEVYTKSKTKTYELANCLHDHFVCENCNLVESVKIQITWKKIISKELKIKEGGVVIYGTCQKCIYK